MRKPVKILLAVCGAGIFGFIICIVICMLFLVFPTNSRDNINPEKQKEMVKIALDVGDLAPIPEGANLRVKTEGSTFTRSFRVEFGADAKTITGWLHDSKGIRTAAVTKTGSVDKYALNPRHGYQIAEVVVDRSTWTVRIYVSWS